MGRAKAIRRWGRRSQPGEMWGPMGVLCIWAALIIWVHRSVSTYHALNGCILLYVDYTTVKLIFRNVNDKLNDFLSTLIKMKRSHAPKDVLGHLRRRTLLTK